jgi:DNA replication protein DnaC
VTEQLAPSGDVGNLPAELLLARAAWERRKLAVLEHDCPSCGDPDDVRFQHCTFRGSEVCRHLGVLQQRSDRTSLEAHMRAGNVPAEFWPVILNRKVNKAGSAIAAVRRLLAGEGRSIILSGTPGSGKSLGAALAIAEQGGVFARAAELDALNAEGAKLVEHLQATQLLVLDDAGAGRSTSDVAAPRVEEILCARWDGRRPTIVTTNLSQAKFWPAFGGEHGRLADRVRSDPVG